MPTPISLVRRQALLAVEDLTRRPGHALHQMVECITSALPRVSPTRLVEGPRIVPAQHNYTLLGYPDDAIVQADTYTQWVDDAHILRTQTTSLVLQALLDVAKDPHPVGLLAPGLVYRRDVRDRWHCAQPHQMDVWCLMPKAEEGHGRLLHAIHRISHHATGLPEKRLSIQPTSHPYTSGGVEISVRWQDQWLEVGEAGLIAPDLLERLGIDPDRWGGLAMGWGLDRLIMVRKQLPDIRLLRDPLPAIAQQMTTLEPWRPVSRQPAARREISIAVPAGQSEEAITDQVLGALSAQQAGLVQSVEITGRWPLADLHPAAIGRLGAQPGQENLLLRITWQSDSASLQRDQVNDWMRGLYRALHQGSSWAYCP